MKARKEKKSCCFSDFYYAEAEKVKVLTHHPKRTETAEEPRPAEGSFAVESSHPATAEARVESAEESFAVEAGSSTPPKQDLQGPLRRVLKQGLWRLLRDHHC